MNTWRSKMLDGLNKTLAEQEKVFEKILMTNKKLMAILKILEEYAKEKDEFKNYYVGAGCINQTIFNYYHRYASDYGINDYDIVYFDNDTSYEAEDVIIKEIEALVKDIEVKVDIKNQARVHLWCSGKSPVSSVEEAISRWCSTVTCIGVRLEKGKFKVFAPYGLNDVFAMIIRPVKFEFPKESYYERAEKWQKKWPKLEIKEW